MRKAITTLVLLTMLAAGKYGAAQTIKRCGSSEYMQQQMAQHPEMVKLREQQEIFTKNYEAQHASAQSKGTGAVYTIPVVVHLLYRPSDYYSNISDAQIQSGIDVLNQDFQLLNADAANVPTAFAGLKADCQIKFCLAGRDPQGKVTNGIIRKDQLILYPNETTDNMKFSAQYGDDAWPSDQYLNIWIVPLLRTDGYRTDKIDAPTYSYSGVGYAQFPGGPAATDGVVITYNVFGVITTPGGGLTFYRKGHTLTHLVGHWLNLEHLWGSGIRNDSCTASDYVADTPPQAGPNIPVTYNQIACPTFPHISCGNGPNGDMFMNFMDWTADDCNLMFTQGQKARMHAVLAPGGLRASLATSPAGCAPALLNATAITHNSAKLSWSGIPSANISYTLEFQPNPTGGILTTSGIGNSYQIAGLYPGTVYSFRVKSNSPTSTGYSYTYYFTTTGCKDNFEPNESLATARQISVNVPVSANISTSTDKDYFRFITSAAAPKIKVLLANLPADYDLKLYSSSGTLLSSSAHTSTTAESIVYNAPLGGTYYVQVYGNNGANSGNCYSLLVQTAGLFGFKGTNVSGSNLSDKFTLYPNPTRGEVSFEYDSKAATTATVSVIDQSGRICKTIQLKLAAGENKPVFNISDLSAGFYFIRITANNETVTTKLFLEQ